MKKKIVALSIAFAMVLGWQSEIHATAGITGIEVPPPAYKEENLDIDPVRNVVNPRMRNTLPATTYVSPYVTSVKDQSPYGTCWAFAFIGASEASMVKEGIAQQDAVDLSELQLAYFLSHSVTDPLGGTEGDDFSLTDTSLNAFLSVGGNQEVATYRVANWYGLVNESTAPYTSIADSEEVVLSEDIAYGADVAHLENAYWISMADKDTVKRLIMEYGACATAYHSGNQYYNTGEASSYNQPEAVAVYCPDDVETDHGIMIVGWDDTYSRDNFGTYKPDSDGAWYCKNSWGSEWSKDGYFWLSYEDVPLNSKEAFFYDYDSADNYDKNYQYDGGAAGAKYQCNYEANIYTAQEDEYIRAVGFYTYDSNYDCTVKVYKNCTGGNPVNGTLLATVEANQLYAGFHTVELGDAYRIREGESFSVVIYQNATDGEKTYIAADYSYRESGKWCIGTSTSKAGQSFIASDGTSWKDVYSDGANCRIKAYTDSRIPVTEVSLDTDELTLYTAETASLSVTVIPENATGKSVTWSSSDDDVVSVDEYGNIVANRAGQADIICTSDDDREVQAMCRITVVQQVSDIDVNYVDCELAAGNSMQLGVTVLPTDAADTSVTWTSDDETVATVSDEGKVTAVGYGKAIITCTATDQNIISDTCVVSVYERMCGITLNTTKAVLDNGDMLQLSATTSPEIRKTKGVYWMSSNSEIITVTQDGLLTVVSEASGEIEIRCIAKDGTGVNTVCSVWANKPEDTVNREKGDTEKPENSVDAYTIINSGSSGAAAVFTSGKNCSGKVTIPKSVTIGGVAYNVTAISDNAFKNNKQITEVVISGNITVIGKNAFSGCSRLRTVSIGNNVRTIGKKAFYQCKKLKNLKLGKKLLSIGDKAFYQCKNLKNITLKTSKLTKKKVGKNAFKGIHAKATFRVPKKKVETYRKLLKAKGAGSRIKVKKY